MSMTQKVTARIPGLAERTDQSPVVSVINLYGVITPRPNPMARGTLNLHSLESTLQRAFSTEGLAAVALVINSPGGAPTQSGLIAERIRELAEDKQVPVLAFAEDLAASGGYWLACAADEIYAHRTSLVGSIGVVSGGFGFAELLARYGIERRLHTAGENKRRLDPFTPEKSADVEWLQGLHGQLHEMFADWVRERRGARLAADTDLFSGDVWLGTTALELGLIDGLGAMREVVSRRYPQARITVTEPKKPLLTRLGLPGPPGLGSAGGLGAGIASGIGAGIGSALAATLDALEDRATWSRFGL